MEITVVSVDGKEKQVELIVEYVKGKKKKEKYTNESFDNLSTESKADIVSSEFWALIGGEKCYGAGTIAEDTPKSARVSHFSMSSVFLETDVAVFLYMQMEEFCIQKGYTQISVRIPDGVKDMSVAMRKFFKKVGFKYTIKERGYSGKYTFLIKVFKECLKEV